MSSVPTSSRAVSFEACLDAEKARLYGIAYSILGNHAEAEDALQEAMYKAWKRWDSVRDDSLRQTWLTRICINRCVDHKRSRSRRRMVGLDDQLAAPIEASYSGVTADINRIYNQLSRQQRAAILLHYYYGYSVDECADLMSCSSGSVRTHVARALTAMRKGMIP